MKTTLLSNGQTREEFANEIAGDYGENFGYKTPCASNCANFLGVTNTVRYLQTIYDLLRAVRNKWTVEAITLDIGATVNQLKLKLFLSKIFMFTRFNGYYLIRCHPIDDWCHGHVLIINSFGKTVADTVEKELDSWEISHVYKIFKVKRK